MFLNRTFKKFLRETNQRPCMVLDQKAFLYECSCKPNSKNLFQFMIQLWPTFVLLTSSTHLKKSVPQGFLKGSLRVLWMDLEPQNKFLKNPFAPRFTEPTHCGPKHLLRKSWTFFNMIFRTHIVYGKKYVPPDHHTHMFLPQTCNISQSCSFKASTF